MNEKILSYLKGEGFTYLWRKSGAHAYKPMKGNMEQLLARTCTTPLWEDDLLSIDDALRSYFSQYFKIAFLRSNRLKDVSVTG